MFVEPSVGGGSQSIREWFTQNTVGIPCADKIDQVIYWEILGIDVEEDWSISSEVMKSSDEMDRESAEIDREHTDSALKTMSFGTANVLPSPPDPQHLYENMLMYLKLSASVQCCI